MKVPASIPYDSIAVDDPERFARMIRLMPWASRTMFVAYGAFVLSSLSHLFLGPAPTTALLAIGVAGFVVGVVLQGMLYRINRDRSILFMVASCACLLSLQAINIWMPRAMPWVAVFTVPWLAMGIASVWLAFAGSSIAKRQTEETEARTRALHESIMKSFSQSEEKDVP